ncbi:OLC1v1006990C1 [Oldenlandia corymbosa var. corymbosa]|uniref:OLC1v1006990C1 n=1 Tax=Oldenlandia corymbosa var. corymbosa TaxID=529605 RepID=A0AAV1DID3_OLDCO|nr:OLC1v1006990C1 [Oldenlandia corymbosa var. corymbosa]
MFKGGGFDIVHSGAIDIMQPPHEQWGDYPNIAFPNYSKPMNNITEKTNHEFVLPQWIEHVTKQLIIEAPEPETGLSSSSPSTLQAQTTTTVYENSTNIVPTLVGDLMMKPRKSARRSYDHNAGNNDHQHHQWCLDDDDEHDHVDDAIISTTKRSSPLMANGDDQSLSFMTILMECAVAISVDNIGEAHKMLLELTQMATPYGPSCAERIVAYFSKAMASRVVNSWLGICSPLISHKTLHSAFQVYNNVSPFIKFAHFTSNQSILEAFHRRERVHIIDLDIMQGLQWPALFHILATRMEGPPHVRMTGMGTSIEVLIETGKNLSNFAKRLGMSFEFHPIARKFGDVDVSMLQIRRGETVAVHWLQHSMYDATGPDWKTMRLLQEISPRVITLVEQEISHGGNFLDRFVGSLHYYSTIFDSLGAYLKSDDPNRHRVEHDLLYKEINNILAIGGPARSGEDKFKHWRNELLRNGFVQIGMSANSMAQAQLILNMFPPSHGYSLVQGDGTLRLGWKDTSLYSVSAWTSPHSR